MRATRLALLAPLLCPSLPAVADDDAITRARRLCAAAGVEVVVVRDLGGIIAAAYDHGRDRILINLGSGHWRNAEARHAHGHAIGLYSSGHPDHVIRHEIGHEKFYRHVGLARAALLRGEAPGLPRGRIAASVSSLAATDAIEFAAEVYAGIWAGKAYPDDVTSCYSRLWHGPYD